MEPILALSVAVITACAVFLWAFGRKFGRLVYLASKVPGPSLWQLLTMYATHLLGADMGTYTWKLCESYKYQTWGAWGVTLDFGAYVSDCEAVSAVYKCKSTRDKPDLVYKQLSEFLGESILAMRNSGPQYSRHRKAFAAALRMSLQDHFLRRLPEAMSKFVEALREEAAGGRDVDLTSLIRTHTMSLMVVAISSVPHDKTPHTVQNLSNSVSRRLELMLMRTINPVYYWLFEHFRSVTKQNKVDCLQAQKEIDEIWMHEKFRALSDTLQDSEDARDIAQALILSYLAKESGEGVDDDVCAMGRTLYVSSFETSAFLLNVLFIVLALHQEVQQRVFDEIESVVGKKRLIQVDDLEQLEYADMVIKETLRLYPAAPIIVKNVSEDILLNGVLVPAGSVIYVHIMALHRNPEYFPDPLKFDPSRFSPEASEERPPYSYIPFSSGVRSCPGQLHAFVMMKFMLCHILRNFKIHPGDKLKSLDDVKVKMSITGHLEESSLRLVDRRSVQTF